MPSKNDPGHDIAQGLFQTPTAVYSSHWNTSSLTNNTIPEARWNTTLLRALSDDMFIRLAPAVAVLVAIMAVGAVGNIVVCYIFIRKLRPSAQNSLLLSLGAFDLMSCCVGVPSEIVDMRNYYLYESLLWCKTSRFLTMLPTLASVVVLLIIAADRYRKICKPLHHQIHRRHVRIALAAIVVLASLLSIPALLLYGHRKIPTSVPDEFGYDCSVSDTYRNQRYPVMYEGLFFALFIICTVALVLLYVRIWKEIRRHLIYMKTHTTFGSGLSGAKSNSSSVNYSESVSSTRRNSETASLNKLGTCRCYSCFRRQRSDPQLERKEALGPNVITKTPQEFETIHEAGRNLNEHSSQDNNDTVDTEDDVKCVSLGNEASQKLINHSIDTRETGCYANTSCNSLHNRKDVANSLISKEGSVHYSKTLINLTEDKNRGCPETTQVESTPHVKCLYSLKIDNESCDAETSTDVVESDAHPSSQPTSASSSSVEKTDESHPRSLFSTGHSDASIDNPSNENSSTNLHSREQSTLQMDAHDCFCQDCHSKSSHQTPSTIKETDADLKSINDCEPHCFESLPEDMQHFHSSFTAFCDYPGRNCSLASQEGSLEDVETIELQEPLSKRVSFSTDLDDFDYSSPAMDTLRLPENYSKKQLYRSRSEQSLLCAKSSKQALRSTRTTIIAFIITVGFILSYLPHLILILLRSVITNFEQQFNDLSLNLYNICLRSYFANNIINVFVYSYMHSEFRTELSALWKRLTC